MNALRTVPMCAVILLSIFGFSSAFADKQKKYGIVALLLITFLSPSFASAEPVSPSNGLTAESHVLTIPIPADVSKDAVIMAGEALKQRLRGIAKDALAREILQKGLSKEEVGAIDRIIIFVDHAGNPILPDLEQARGHFSVLPEPSATVTTTANELTFTFDSPDHPWSAEELAVLDTTLNDVYPIAKTIYGNPAFAITVNVVKDPTISFAGFYNSTLNEMTLQTASNSGTLCHEMIHALRDDDIIILTSYEEGMTRAAEVEVFNRLPTYPHFDKHHSYEYDVYYEGLNKQKIGSRKGNLFAGYVSPFLRYQLAGYAWGKALIENPKFLVNFNRKLYAKILSDPTTRYTESALLNIAAEVKPRVENALFLKWYGKQGVLKTNPPKGYFLYQRINQFTVDYFYRDSSGIESMQPDAVIHWAVYDYRNILLDNGSGVTSANGFIIFTPVLPEGYTGRIKVAVSTESPNGKITDRSQRIAKSGTGVFGIITKANTGTVTITKLNAPVASVKVNVADGAFFAPSLESKRGRFRAVFENPAGQTFTKYFTKDASDYFLSINDR